MCIPPVLLVLSIVTSLGASITTLIVAIGVGQIAAFTRVIRSVILNIKGADFLEAARACGAKDWRIILRHLIPNAIGPVIVQGTMNVATVIIFAASISFIGMGVQPPQPEWGVMLGETKDYMRINPLLTIIPGLAIVFTSLSFNLFGDGLRDALDPRLKD
jgi:peptide/nickel transport system permease protein